MMRRCKQRHATHDAKLTSRYKQRRIRSRLWDLYRDSVSWRVDWYARGADGNWRKRFYRARRGAVRLPFGSGVKSPNRPLQRYGAGALIILEVLH